MSRAQLRGLPATLGRYELVGLLGRGGMGRVVRARDPVLKRDVALKLIEGADPETGAEVRFHFHREARAVAQLKHPSIIEVYDYSGPDAPLPFIACELIAAPTLRDGLDARGEPVSPEVCAALGYELASALEHAHERGVVHRDVKPENVFWQRDGRVVLADFGIAKALDASALGVTVQFGQTNLYGSPAYLAPELLAGAAAEPRTDLYALGLLLFEALTGTQAIAGESLEEILEAAAQARRAELPPEHRGTPLAALIDELTAKEPDERPGSAAEVRARSRLVLDGMRVSDPRIVLTWSEAPVVEEREPRAGNRGPETENREPITEDRGPKAGSLALLGLFIVLACLAAWRLLERAPPLVEALVLVPGPATLRADGVDVGAVKDTARVKLAPGRHQLEAVLRDGRVLSREVVVLEGVEPVFELAD